MADSDRVSFSISEGEIGSKKNEDEGDGPRKYSGKLCLDCGVTDASLNPTVAKCVLRTSEISSGFAVTRLLLGYLIEEISCLRLSLRPVKLFIPSQIFFVLFRLCDSS